MRRGTISIEHLVEDDAFVRDCYTYSTRKSRRRFVNDNQRSGEQVWRSRVVNAIKREDIEMFGVDEDVLREGCGRDFPQPV